MQAVCGCPIIQIICDNHSNGFVQVTPISTRCTVWALLLLRDKSQWLPVTAELALHSDSVLQQEPRDLNTQYTHKALGRCIVYCYPTFGSQLDWLPLHTKGVSHECNVFNGNYTKLWGCELLNSGFSCLKQNSCGCWRNSCVFNYVLLLHVEQKYKCHKHYNLLKKFEYLLPMHI